MYENRKLHLQVRTPVRMHQEGVIMLDEKYPFGDGEWYVVSTDTNPVDGVRYLNVAFYNVHDEGGPRRVEMSPVSIGVDTVWHTRIIDPPLNKVEGGLPG